jgi:hypothetical protein
MRLRDPAASIPERSAHARLQNSLSKLGREMQLGIIAAAT